MNTPRPLTRRVAFASLLGTFAVTVACGGQEAPARSVGSSPGQKDPPALQQVSIACARIASCARAHDIPRLRDPSACFDWWLAHADPRVPDPLHACLTQATTCQGIETCMHGAGDARAAQFCAARPGVVSGCDDNRLVSCGDEEGLESTVTDCASVGATCREVKSAGGLMTRACYEAQKCPPGAPEARCDGDRAVLSCHDGAIEHARCAPGTRCEEHRDESGEASASCELPGRRRCGVLGGRHCEGDHLVECAGQDPVGKIRVSDCAGFGLRCSGTGPRAGCYVPADVECDKEMLPRCADSGRSLVFCAAGRTVKITCSSLGMGACDPTARGAIAACSPRVRNATPPAPN